MTMITVLCKVEVYSGVTPVQGKIRPTAYTTQLRTIILLDRMSLNGGLDVEERKIRSELEVDFILLEKNWTKLENNELECWDLYFCFHISLFKHSYHVNSEWDWMHEKIIRALCHTQSSHENE